MCAILDANVVHEVFGFNRPPGGKKFFDWINKGHGRLVLGGKLLKELHKGHRNFSQWTKEAIAAGRVGITNASQVDTREEHLRREGRCGSNDPHVIGLAQISGARLLYSNDRDLQQDFQNRQLIDSPRGKVYSTGKHQSFEDSHQRLLRRNDLCGTGR